MEGYNHYKLTNYAYSYAVYAGFALLIILSAVYSSILLLALSAFLLFASVFVLRYGHIFNSFLTNKMKILEVSSGYSLGKRGFSAVKKIGTSYYGISIASLKVTTGVNAGSRIITEAIEKIRIQFEFSVRLERIDLKKLLNGLETRRRIKEIELSKIGAKDYDKANRLKREIGIVESEIQSITCGNTPMSAMLLLKCASVCKSSEEAQMLPYKNLQELCTLFASSFNFDYIILKGEDLLELL
jgi:hypothetical protein